MDNPSPDTTLNGLPSWITPELISETIRAWQPYYAQPLTVQDAIGILLSVGNLFAVLAEG
jgi:hypothetical protein